MLRDIQKKALELEKKGNLKDALLLYLELVKQDSKNASHYNASAVLFYKLQQYKDAVRYFKEAIKHRPKYAEAYSNLGAVYAKFKSYTKAIELYQKAIELKPSYAGSYTNLGNALNKSGEYEQAVYFHLRAIAIDPKSANHYANLGSAYKNLGRFDRAKAMYKKAIALEPKHINAHFDLSTVLLQTDEYAEAWGEYEWRFAKDEMQGFILKYKEVFQTKRYSGQNLNGERVVVLGEQGFGDSIMMARYLYELKSRGARVIVYQRSALLALFQNLPCVDEVLSRDEEPPNCEFYVCMMSLPLVLDKYLKNVNKNYPYIELKKSYELASKKIKIGIAWGGSNSGDSYKNKVFDLRHFRVMSQIKDIQLYSLQLGNDSAQIKEYGMQDNIIDLSENINNFEDTATIINNLDLVISSDTSVVHLAGAMGKKTWCLLQKVPDWRWGVDACQSKWYPSVKIFKQHSLGDFNSVFKQVYAELYKEFKIEVKDV